MQIRTHNRSATELIRRIMTTSRSGELFHSSGEDNIRKEYREYAKIIHPDICDDPDAAIRIMKAAIANDEWAKRLPAIRAAKERLFAEYNFWAQVIRVVESARGQRVTAPDPAHPHVLRSRRWLRRHSLSANLEDGWFHFKQYLSGVGLWPKMS